MLDGKARFGGWGMSGYRRLAGVLLTVTLFVFATPAVACPVCIDRPEATLADRLLRAEVVIVAREDPAQPFHFAPVGILKGTVGAEPIPLLLDSTTRRRLSARPDAGVLLLRDGDDWTRAGFADTVWRETVMTILSEGPRWSRASDERFRFFEALLHHADDRVRHLAIDELSRARYGLIRAMPRPIDGTTARRALVDRFEIPWASFYILMLGLSERPGDQALVRDRHAAIARLGGSRELGAWAAALIEIDGAAAIGRLAKTWFETPGRDVEALRDVITALAVHGREGDPALRPTILATLGDVPLLRPDLGGSVAAALGEIGDFSQADVIERAMLDAARRNDVALREPELLAAGLYVSRARRAEDAAADRREVSR